jgi:hypothetical protein
LLSGARLRAVAPSGCLRRVCRCGSRRVSGVATVITHNGSPSDRSGRAWPEASRPFRVRSGGDTLRAAPWASSTTSACANTESMYGPSTVATAAPFIRVRPAGSATTVIASRTTHSASNSESPRPTLGQPSTRNVANRAVARSRTGPPCVVTSGSSSSAPSPETIARTSGLSAAAVRNASNAASSAAAGSSARARIASSTVARNSSTSRRTSTCANSSREPNSGWSAATNAAPLG